MANDGMLWFQVPKLKGSKFDNWIIKIKALTYDVWEVMEKGFTVLENEATLTATQKKNLKDLKKNENKVTYSIFQSLDGDDFEKIVGATSSKEA